MEAGVRRTRNQQIKSCQRTVPRRALTVHFLQTEDVGVHPPELRAHDGDPLNQRRGSGTRIVEVLDIERGDAERRHGSLRDSLPTHNDPARGSA
jgi:hypothetical protein